jgi:hypothetical protein
MQLHAYLWEDREMAELNVAADTAFRLVEVLHELMGQDRGLERDDSEGEGDDAAAEGLAAEPDDARQGEIATFLRDLNADEQVDIAALIALGREEFDVTEWEAAKSAARQELGESGADVLVEMVTGDEAAAEFLESGMEAFGYSFAEWDAETVVAPPETDGGREPGDVADEAQRQTPGHVARR